ncbi:MAG TPA: hypothetical protein VKX17_27615 [Planctomycetota bacterium]|nr:hypothetical protein [Planctomycetota bacterium]
MSEGTFNLRRFRLLVAIPVAIVIIAAGGWFALLLTAKLKYDKARQFSNEAYAVVPMDRETIKLLSEVESTWICKSDEKNGPRSEMIKLAGMTPSVRTFIEVQDYQMPPYQWFSPSKNAQAAKLGLIKLEFFMLATDQKWHISEDGHLALLRARNGAVFVFRDEKDGFRATLYVKQTNDGAGSATKERAP